MSDWATTTTTKRLDSYALRSKKFRFFSQLKFVNMASSEKSNIKKYKNYSEEQLKLAVNSVTRKERSLRAASQTFKVPKETISRWIRGVNSGERTKSVLDPHEEQHLKEYIFSCAKLGYACSNKVIIDSALHIIWSRKDPVKRNVENLTNGWVQSFLKRHSDISKRTPQMVTKASATVTKQNLLDHFERVKANIDEDGQSDIWSDPRRIFSGDETGVALNPEESKCFAEKGSKQVVQIATNQEKVQVSVMYNFQATGEMLPPFILFKRTSKIEEISQQMPGKTIDFKTNLDFNQIFQFQMITCFISMSRVGWTLIVSASTWKPLRVGPPRGMFSSRSCTSSMATDHTHRSSPSREQENLRSFSSFCFLTQQELIKWLIK